MDLKKKENSDMKKLQYNNCKILKCIVSTASANADKAPDKPSFIVDTGSDGEFCGVGLMSKKELQEFFPNAYVEKKIAITAFDKSVMDAIYTIWCDRYDGVSKYVDIPLVDIYVCMTGGLNINPNQAHREKIKLSVFKLIYVSCVVNVSADMDQVIDRLGLREQIGNDGAGAVIDGPLVNGYLISIKRANGTFSSGLRLTDCPVLYQYAEAIKHIIQIDDEWLRLPYSLSDKMIGVRDYLIGYIKSLKHRKEDSSQWVGYKTIFEGAGLEWSENPSTKSKNRALVNKVLEYYKSAKLIKDYIVSEDLRKISIEPVDNKKTKK